MAEARWIFGKLIVFVIFSNVWEKEPITIMKDVFSCCVAETVIFFATLENIFPYRQTVIDSLFLLLRQPSDQGMSPTQFTSVPQLPPCTILPVMHLAQVSTCQIRSIRIEDSTDLTRPLWEFCQRKERLRRLLPTWHVYFHEKRSSY